MSKRIVCILLALIMFVGLIPAGAISASAAGLTVSENGIKLIKDFEGFKEKAYPDGSQYTYGYGTKAPSATATITEANADMILREELRTIDTKVNNFAASNGLVLSQAKHDALVSFTFNVGWAWMSQPTYRITKAVISGATGNDFLQAMTLWSNVDSIPSTGLINRRMAEANLYLNGVYNKTAPTNYTYVTFDANGGTLGEDRVQAYNVSTPTTITSVPTRAGYTFLGWYTSTKADATWVGVLNSTTSNKVLYARWQDDSAVTDGKVVGTPTSYIISGLNFASNKVYSVPNSNNAAVETIDQNDTFKVTAEYVDNNRDKWLKIESGWVKLGQIKVTTTTGTGTPTITVTSDTLNIRQEASASSTKLGELKKGNQVIITEVKEVGGALWGKCSEGWISLMYTNYGTITNTSGTTTSGSSATSNVVIATGTVLTNATNLNVRVGAGLTNGIVGTLTRNTKVDIYEITNVNGHGWGRIGEGKWVCLDYVNYKKVDTVTNNNETGTGPVVIDEPYKFKATVNVDGLNIYSDPTISQANPIGSLNRNANVNIFEIVSDGGTVFGKIISNNIVGWIQLAKTTYTASGVVSVANAKGTDILLTGGADSGKDALNGTAVTILEISATGSKLYGRIQEGWIDLSAVKLNTTKAPIVTGAEFNASNTATNSNGKVIFTGIVNSGINLNVRLGAGVNFDVVHSLTNGTEVKVYDKTEVNGHFWGKLGDNAWICLTYVTETTGTTNDTTNGSNANSNVTAMNEMATVVNCSVGVNIRSTPSTSGALLGSAPLNSRVKVLETTVYNGTKWARTEEGWISMLYLKLDSDTSYGSNSAVSVNGLFSATVLVNQINVTDSIGGGATVATMKKGESAYVTEIQSANATTISGKVTVNGKTGWIDLSNTTFVAKGQVTSATANVRKVPKVVTDADIVDTLSSGSFVTVLEIRAEDAGAGQTRLWGKLAMDKWICLENVKLVSTSANTSSSNVVTTGMGKIAYTDTVNVRKAAGTNNDIVTKLNRGTQVTLYEETVVDDAIWVRISTSSVNGWVAKDYIEVTFAPTTVGGSNTGTGTTGSNTSTTTQTSNYATGMVNSNTPLKVRQQPDINAPIVTELPYGMTITIYEQRKGGNMDWGRIDNGWVSLSYVTMTSTGSTGAGDMGTIIKAFSKVNVRAEATTTSAKVGEVMVGSRVEVLEQKFVNGYTWYRINNGWVHGDYIQLDAPFVGHNTNNNNTQNDVPATGPQDEVGGMSTTAIVKHRVNDVVVFYKDPAAALNAANENKKLVNGETVVITELKAFGVVVWANTAHGWFNLTDESINFTAVGMVNTTNDNYLPVYSEAGKDGTEPVAQIRDGASITLTGVSVSGGKLWGKTASGWVNLDHVELTCVKQGATSTPAVITPIQLTPYDPDRQLFSAIAKDQHLAINVYDAVNGKMIGVFDKIAFIVEDVAASGMDIWVATRATGVSGKVWVKYSDVTQLTAITDKVTIACDATSSAGGNSVTGSFKFMDDVTCNNLVVANAKICAQVTTGANAGSWIYLENLSKFNTVPQAVVGEALATTDTYAGTYAFKGTMNTDVIMMDAPGGALTGGYALNGKTALVTKLALKDGTMWAEVVVTLTAADYTTSTVKRYIELKNINFSFTGTTDTALNVRSSKLLVDNVLQTLETGATVTVRAVEYQASNLITWAKVDWKDTNGNAVDAYVDFAHLIVEGLG